MNRFCYLVTCVSDLVLPQNLGHFLKIYSQTYFFSLVPAETYGSLALNSASNSAFKDWCLATRYFNRSVSFPVATPTL